MGNRSMFVGLDVHEDTIDVSVADGGRDGEVRHDGVIPSDREPLDKVAGELRAIYVPDATDEAMRDLVRARADALVVSIQAKSRLKAFLLRQGRRYPGRDGWTLAYRRWLPDLSFPTAAQHITLQVYRDTIDETERRPARLTEQLRQLVPAWRWAPVVAALQALRGISFVTAGALVAELGDLTRFTQPRELMAYLGLVPSEHSSGPSVRRGGITKAGNPHVRRLLAEAAWAYQGIPRVGRQHAYRQEALPKIVCDIAWAAQVRLPGRFRRLVTRQAEAESRHGHRP